MTSRRMAQVNQLLKEELSELILREVKDPRIGFVTLTEVKVSPDLHQAQVYFSVLGDEEELQDSRAALEHAAGFLRHQLGRRLALRYIPELHFIYDRSLERAQRIETLLRQIHEQEEPSAGE